MRRTRHCSRHFVLLTSYAAQQKDTIGECDFSAQSYFIINIIIIFVIKDEILLYLENSGRKNIVAIDEFQQIGEYPQKNVEALLRTKIQMCTMTQFIFAGSKKHMMSNMFHSSAKPFYQSVITMGLNPIPLEIYTDFAQKLFEEKGKRLDAEIVEKVYNSGVYFPQSSEKFPHKCRILFPTFAL